MERTLKIVFILGVAAILATDVAGFVQYSAPRQVRLHSPVPGFAYPRTFLAAGEAWTPDGLPPVQVQARNPSSGTVLSFDAARETVKYRGAVVNELAAFSARLALPEEGRWVIQAVMRDPSGRQPAELASDQRTITVRAGAPDRLFVAFGTGHLIAISVLLALCLAVILRYRKPRTPGEVRAVSLFIAFALLVNELAYHLYWVFIRGWTASTTLMVHMCSLSVFFVPFLLFMKEGKGRQLLFEIVYYWGLGGALQAYLAPDIWVHSFPELRFFTFFVAHGLLVLGPLFFALTSGLALTIRSYLRVGAITLAMTALVYGFNQVFRLIPPYEPSNYWVMGYPPPTGSIVDVFANIFGPSPAYGIGLVLMGVVLFYILYVPFPILRIARNRRARGRAGT